MPTSQLAFSRIPLYVVMPIHWVEFVMYSLFLLYKVCIKKMRIEGQLKWAVYAFNIPMLGRALTSSILLSLR